MDSSIFYFASRRFTLKFFHIYLTVLLYAYSYLPLFILQYFFMHTHIYPYLSYSTSLCILIFTLIYLTVLLYAYSYLPLFSFLNLSWSHIRNPNPKINYLGLIEIFGKLYTQYLHSIVFHITLENISFKHKNSYLQNKLSCEKEYKH